MFGITRERVLSGALFVQRFKKLIYMRLFRPFYEDFSSIIGKNAVVYSRQSTSTLILCAESLLFRCFGNAPVTHNMPQRLLLNPCGDSDVNYYGPHLGKPVLKELQNIKYLTELWMDFHNAFLFYLFSLKQALSLQKRFNNVWKKSILF